MKTCLFPAGERGTKDSGWLKSQFNFSFSNYYNPVMSAFGTLQAFNDDLLEPGKGFGIHPHINMEIISILLKGEMNHKDTLGYSTIIGPGGVQIMSAGNGLRHEEYNIGEDTVNFLQIWIQPKIQNIMPRYQTRTFPREGRKNKLVTVVSHEEGLSHCWINQHAKLSLGYFEEDETTEYRFDKENKCLFIFMIEGSMKVGETLINKRDALGVWDTDQVYLKPLSEVEYLVIETPVNQK